MWKCFLKIKFRIHTTHGWKLCSVFCHICCLVTNSLQYSTVSMWPDQGKREWQPRRKVDKDKQVERVKVKMVEGEGSWDRGLSQAGTKVRKTGRVKRGGGNGKRWNSWGKEETLEKKGWKEGGKKHGTDEVRWGEEGWKTEKGRRNNCRKD